MPNEKSADNIYPGEAATPHQIIQLADAYRGSALLLLANVAGKSTLWRAPVRFTAMHAIELYLNAYLRYLGREPRELRALKHDLQKRISIAMDSGLVLRVRTVRHLEELAEGREYLTTRYGAESLTSGPELTRIAATLNELASKVSDRIHPD